ncbi:MAG: M1 family metallopeptidase [Longispora sp.]|nr:M1 family metallopeptidase [Longispora sp. (in: high G+C Gram-positive bacteria)]
MFRTTQSRRVRTALVAAAVVAGVLTTSGMAEAGIGPVRGAAGIGDSYYPAYGNGGYDVIHYDVKLKYQPTTDQLEGTTTIKAKTKQHLSAFNLDFALDVSSVTVNGRPAVYERNGEHELTITPDRAIRNHTEITVVVQYAGIPSKVLVDGWSAWKRTSDGALAVGEPEISWWWYPSNDHPQDKATHAITVTVPEGVEAISNGVLTVQPTTTDGWATWRWRSKKPMAPYLAFVAIGQYQIENTTAPNGQPVTYAFAENLGEYADNARASIRRTPEIIDWASKLFGPYPFEAQGGVAAPLDGIGFALENQTRPVYSWKFWRKGPNPYVVVHELAHQWYGDNVSVHDWRNIWLNEGFAAYAEWLWSEQHGEGTAQEIFDTSFAKLPAEHSFWQVAPGDPGADALFNSAVYNRGAMALHQIRLAVGDKKFFAVLTGWGKHKRYRTATIEEFRAYMERLSGKDLQSVFDTWLFTKGKPVMSDTTPKAAPVEPASWDMLMNSHEHSSHEH